MEKPDEPTELEVKIDLINRKLDKLFKSLPLLERLTSDFELKQELRERDADISASAARFLKKQKGKNRT